MVQQARLIHGRSYTLNGGRGGKSKVFKRSDEPDSDWVTVTDKEREWLEENALERIVTHQGKSKRTQFIPKFEFQEGVAVEAAEDAGEVDQEPPAPRRRSRSR
jgi:hypothetical protein